MVTKWYLAGPMSGLPQMNFPMFERVERLLRKQGYDMVSPAELDSPEEQALAMQSNGEWMSHMTWGDFLARDVKIIADAVQGMILLPGWERSRGARLEATVGLLQKTFQFMRWDENGSYPVPVSRRTVACAIHAEFMS